MIINSKTIFDSDDDEEYDEEDEVGLFFKDFSPDAPRLSTVLNKKKRASRKASSKKATTRMSKFDLMSFANHLHDNRLSVMQLRESRIALTEEDEQELIKLLEKRKSMANSVHQMPLPSDESIPAVPPLPDNADKEHEQEDAPVESSTSTTQEENKAQNATAAADDDDGLHKDIDEQQPVEKKEEEKENDTASSLDTTPKAPLEEPAASLLIEKEVSRKRRVRKSMSMDEIHRMQQAQEEKTLVEMEPIQEVEPSLSSSSTHKSHNNNNNNKSDSKVAPPNITIKPSTSTPSIKSRHSESPKPSPRNKAIGLFGSLRQASRATPLRGLVRNLSTNASRLSRQASFTRSSTSNTYNNKFASSSRATLATQNGEDLSPAARAVMQHNDKQQRKKDSKKNNDEEQEQQQQPQEESSPKKSRLLTHLLAKAGKARRTKTVNMASSSTSTANKRRDKTKSKIVRRTIIYVPPDSLNFMKNLEKGDIDTSKTPTTTSGQDDLTAMPPLPNDMMKRIQQYNEESGSNPSEELQQHHDELDSVLNYYDDESLYDYYRNRESSVPQLEGLELREMDDGTVEWGIVKKQGNRKSFFAAHGMNVSCSPEQNGTTTPTKSDVAHEMMEEEDDEEDEEKIEEHVLRLMGLPVPTPPSPKNNTHLSASTSPPPVPRRSPRRRMESSSSNQQQQHEDDEQDHRRAKHISTIHSRKDASTTDVYFAPQQTLPSLLQMIANTSGGDDGDHEQEKKHASVEEQLDEVMRSFQPPTSVH